MISSCASLHGITAFLLLISFAGAQSGGDDTTPSEFQHLSPSLVLTLTGIVVSLFFLVFLFALYVRYCDNGAISGSVRAISGGISRRPAVKGLDKSAIETFPTFVYSSVKELKIGKGALECAVCLSEFDDDETLRLIPNCSHVFHPDCIALWLASHTTCPVCRAELSAEKSGTSDSDAEHDDGGERVEIQVQLRPTEHLVMMDANETPNRNRTRGSRSGRARKFPKSHSTGHSLPVQPGEDTERFTLRLPAEVRRQIMKNRLLQRSNSMVVLPTERSSRWEYRTSCEGSGGGRKSFRCLDSVGEVMKSDRRVFSTAPTFLMRAVSVTTPKVAEENRGTSPILPRAKSSKSWKAMAADDCQVGGSGSPRQSHQFPV